jgi:NLI interacting factor-like phosphatase
MAHNSKHNPENLLLIEGWRGDPEDKELLKIIPFLKLLSAVKDVRSISKWQKLFLSKDCLNVATYSGHQIHVCRSRLIRKTAELINQVVLNEWEQSLGKPSIWCSPEHHKWIFEERFYLTQGFESDWSKRMYRAVVETGPDLKDPRAGVQRSILDEYLLVARQATLTCM